MEEAALPPPPSSSKWGIAGGAQLQQGSEGRGSWPSPRRLLSG